MRKLGMIPPEYFLNLFRAKNYFNEDLRVYIESNVRKFWDSIQRKKNKYKKCKKITFTSKKMAKRKLKTFRSEIPHGEKRPVALYRCAHCNYWHHTSMPKDKWYRFLSGKKKKED